MARPIKDELFQKLVEDAEASCANEYLVVKKLFFRCAIVDAYKRGWKESRDALTLSDLDDIKATFP